MKNSYQTTNKMVPLQKNYAPHKFDVICAKGREAKNHSGNIFYTNLINEVFPRYSKACNKLEKTLIVSEIVDKVRSLSPMGGFIKREKLSKIDVVYDVDVGSTCSSTNYQYYEVGDHIAREKVGQSLRDRLSNQYKSSTKSKRRRREALGANITNEVENMIRNNVFVCNCINDLTEAATTSSMFLRYYTKEENNGNVKEKESEDEGTSEDKTKVESILNGNGGDDEERRVIELFTHTNLEILEAFKLDKQLLEQFRAAEYIHKTTFSNYS